MSATALQLFNAICPQYANDSNYSIFADLATQLTSSSFFGDVNYNYAVALRTAHMLTLSKRLTGDGGYYSSKSEGDLSVNFHVLNTLKNASLSQTSYGIELENLIRISMPAISVAGNAMMDGSSSNRPWW